MNAIRIIASSFLPKLSAKLNLGKMNTRMKVLQNVTGRGNIAFGCKLLLSALIVLSLALYGCGKKQIVTQRQKYAKPLPKQSPLIPDKKIDKKNLGNLLVMTANRQLGRPYLWGGNAPEKGFDCSGLVWWVYRRHGMGIPRVTHAQKKAGRGVNDFKPGDLVFFRIAETAKGLHVGIYAGEYSFIHSAKKGSGVRVDSILKPYWHSRFIGARRIIPGN